MAKTLDNSEEMGKFLNTYITPRKNHEEIENLKRPTCKEIESVKAGAEVKFNYTPKAGYIVKNISLVNLDTNKG